MTVRKCQTCKHFEQSPIWRKGWCRNPRLYSPQQSHLVGQDDLDCSRGLGDYWEPIVAPATEPARPIATDTTGAASVTDQATKSASQATASEPAAAETSNKSEQLDPAADAAPVRQERRHPLRFFSNPPRLAPAPAGMLASATSGGGGSGIGGGGSSGSSSGRGSGPAGGDPPDHSEPSRPARARMTPGQERAVSYQPEERYWTDYLRIALPVIGLLLMLGLFWFWASSLIRGDDSGTSPTSTPKGQVAVVRTVTAPAAAASKPAVVITPQTAATATPTPATGQQPQPQTQGQTGQTTQPPASTAATGNNATTGGAASTAGAAQFKSGDVVSTTDTVNLRDQPTTSGNIITSLDPGTQLTITGSPQQADGYTWYPVKDVNGDEGYVASDFLQASGQ